MSTSNLNSNLNSKHTIIKSNGISTITIPNIESKLKTESETYQVDIQSESFLSIISNLEQLFRTSKLTGKFTISFNCGGITGAEYTSIKKIKSP